MVGYLQAGFISSGVFEKLNISIDDGTMMQVDVVWAYTLPKGILITIPVVLGAKFLFADRMLPISETNNLPIKGRALNDIDC